MLHYSSIELDGRKVCLYVIVIIPEASIVGMDSAEKSCDTLCHTLNSFV